MEHLLYVNRTFGFQHLICLLCIYMFLHNCAVKSVMWQQVCSSSIVGVSLSLAIISPPTLVLAVASKWPHVELISLKWLFDPYLWPCYVLC